jgi:hypothetical protein
MRQFLDALVWLAMISVVAAVIYFTPRFANSSATTDYRHGQECEGSCAEITSPNFDSADMNP